MPELEDPTVTQGTVVSLTTQGFKLETVIRNDEGQVVADYRGVNARLLPGDLATRLSMEKQQEFWDRNKQWLALAFAGLG